MFRSVEGCSNNLTKVLGGFVNLPEVSRLLFIKDP